MPAAKKFDNVRVNVAIQESHGAPSLKGGGADVSGPESGGGKTLGCSKPQLAGDVGSFDAHGHIVSTVCGKLGGTIVSGVDRPEMAEVSKCQSERCSDGAAETITAAFVSH